MSSSQQSYVAALPQASEACNPDESTEVVLATSVRPDTVIHRNHYESVVVRGKAHAHVGDVIIDQQHTYNVVQYVKCSKQHEGNCESNINGDQRPNAEEFNESAHSSTAEDITSEIRAIFDRLLYCVKDVEYSSKDLLYSSKDLIHNSEKIIHVSQDVLHITQDTVTSTQVALSAAQDTMTHAQGMFLSTQRIWELQEEMSNLKEKVEVGGILLSMVSDRPWRHLWDYADFRFQILYLTKAARAGLKWLLPDLIAPEVSSPSALERYISERKAGSHQSITYAQAARFIYDDLPQHQRLTLFRSTLAVIVIAKYMAVIVTLLLSLKAALEDFTSLIPRQDTLVFATYFNVGQILGSVLPICWEYYNSTEDARRDTWRQLLSRDMLNVLLCWYLWVVLCTTLYVQEELFVMTVTHEPVKQVCQTRYFDHEWVSWFSELSSTFASLVQAQRRCEAHDWEVNTGPYCPPNIRRVDIMVNGTWVRIMCPETCGNCWWYGILP